MNIRVDLNYPIKDGTEVVFRSPVDCSQVTGLKVYYIGEDGNAYSKEFAFADAHGNNVGDIDHLFAENVAVKVILDVTTSMAFVQNADTNAYLEGRFAELEGKIGKGGLSTMIVRMQDEDYADETAEVINQHIAHGGLAYFFDGECYYPLAADVANSASIGLIQTYNGKFLYVEIDVDGTVTYNESDYSDLADNLSGVAKDVLTLMQQMDDIETALDRIIDIQNELIGGGA